MPPPSIGIGGLLHMPKALVSNHESGLKPAQTCAVNIK
jgi:hypothetical protein